MESTSELDKPSSTTPLSNNEIKTTNKSDSSNNTSTDTSSNTTLTPPSKKSFHSTNTNNDKSPLNTTVLASDTGSSESLSISPIQTDTIQVSEGATSVEKTYLTLQPLDDPSGGPLVMYDCVVEGNTITITKDASSSGYGPDVIIEELSPAEDQQAISLIASSKSTNDNTNSTSEEYHPIKIKKTHDVIDLKVGDSPENKSQVKKNVRSNRCTGMRPSSRISHAGDNLQNMRESASRYGGFNQQLHHPRDKLQSSNSSVIYRGFKDFKKPNKRSPTSLSRRASLKADAKRRLRKEKVSGNVVVLSDDDDEVVDIPSSSSDEDDVISTTSPIDLKKGTTLSPQKDKTVVSNTPPVTSKTKQHHVKSPPKDINVYYEKPDLENILSAQINILSQESNETEDSNTNTSSETIEKNEKANAEQNMKKALQVDITDKASDKNEAILISPTTPIMTDILPSLPERTPIILSPDTTTKTNLLEFPSVSQESINEKVATTTCNQIDEISPEDSQKTTTETTSTTSTSSDSQNVNNTVFSTESTIVDSAEKTVVNKSRDHNKAFLDETTTQQSEKYDKKTNQTFLGLLKQKISKKKTDNSLKPSISKTVSTDTQTKNGNLTEKDDPSVELPNSQVHTQEVNLLVDIMEGNFSQNEPQKSQSASFTELPKKAKSKKRPAAYHLGTAAFLCELDRDEKPKKKKIKTCANKKDDTDFSVHVKINDSIDSKTSSENNSPQSSTNQSNSGESIGTADINKNENNLETDILEQGHVPSLITTRNEQLDTGHDKSIQDGDVTNKNVMIDQGEIESVGYYENPVSYNFSNPQAIAFAKKEFRSSRENYLRGCSWSPDGVSILTNSDDNIIRLFTPAQDMYHQDKENEHIAEMSAVLRMREGETIYSMDWYPYMDSTQVDTCCFVTTSKDHPIHLWDAVSGKVRCSYRAFDHMDELSSAHCVRFNMDGSKIYCGFNKVVRIFDASRPGREFTEINTVDDIEFALLYDVNVSIPRESPKQSRFGFRNKNFTRRWRQKSAKKQNGKGKRRSGLKLNQAGIISSIDFSNEHTGLIAMGSFSRTVGLYSSYDNKIIDLLTPDIGGHSGGITQVKFTSDGGYLFSGARKDNDLICWDMRNTSMPLFKLKREVKTNQRIQFDVDRKKVLHKMLTSKIRYGCFVVSGGTNEMINMYDMNPIFQNISDDVITHSPSSSFRAHEDAVNAVSLNPTQPYLASTSGQRHFLLRDSDSDGEESSSKTPPRITFDNSLKIWKL